jgi:hypothetical protein
MEAYCSKHGTIYVCFTREKFFYLGSAKNSLLPYFLQVLCLISKIPTQLTYHVMRFLSFVLVGLIVALPIVLWFLFCSGDFEPSSMRRRYIFGGKSKDEDNSDEGRGRQIGTV